MITRHGWQVVGAFTSLLLAAMASTAAIAPAGAVRPATGVEEESARVFVVTAGDESTQTAIAEQAKVDPEYRAQVEELVAGWSKDLASGRHLDLGTITEGRSTRESLVALTELQDTIRDQPAGSSAESALAPTASGENPNTFPVRGSRGSGRTFWEDMKLIVAGHFCGTNGCDAQDTDRITCRLTINPGAKTSRYDSNCLYSPNSGKFGDRHYELWAINRGNVVGNKDTGRLFSGSGGSSSHFLSSSRKLNGTVLTSAAKLWVEIRPLGAYIGDGAKTADATCNNSNNVCKY